MHTSAPEIIRRVDRILEQADGRFPVYADPDHGEWTWSADGGWTGGFWAGLLWLSATATGDTRYARAAREFAERLQPHAVAPTVLRGFLFWYGTGIAERLGHDVGGLADTADRAGLDLARTFDPVGALIPPGAEDGDRYEWPTPSAVIDCLPGTVPLLALTAEHTQDHTLRSTAISHARSLAAFCVRDDGSVAQSANYDRSGALVSRTSFNGSCPVSTWSRGQAWAMLGLAQAAQIATEFIQPATRVADWYLDHIPADSVCYWDFDDPAIPDAPRDTSAAAIATAALAKLAPLAGDHYGEPPRPRYRR